MMRRFSQTVLTLLLMVCCALTPTMVSAQQAGPSQPAKEKADGDVYDAYFMSDEHRQEIYEKNRKSPGKAILWTALLPGLGNIYAEQYLLAGMGIIFMVFAGTFVGYGLTTRQPGIVVLGGVTAGIAYTGGAVSSVIGVSRYNDKLRRGLKVEKAELREAWSPMITLRF